MNAIKAATTVLGITVRRARWIFIWSFIALAMLACLNLIFIEVRTSIPFSVSVLTYIAGALAVLLLCFSGWIGYTTHGKTFAVASNAGRQEGRSFARRIPKLLFASFALAFGLFLVATVISLVLAGADGVSAIWGNWMLPLLGVLTVISFPVMHRWLK